MKDSCHLLIIDGRPAAETTSLDVADESDLVIITTGTTIDDLEPSLELARELIKKGIEKNKIVFIVAKSPSQSQGRKSSGNNQSVGLQSSQYNHSIQNQLRRGSGCGACPP
jgi:chromosome partitioning protein